MADSYVDGKVREALIAAHGNRTGAQKLLMTWAMKDGRLCQGLAAPFLKAIAGAAVEGAWRRGVRGGTDGGQRPPAAPLPRDALHSVLSQIGRHEETTAAATEIPGVRMLSLSDVVDRPPTPAAPATGSGRQPSQATALRTLAAAFKTTKPHR